MASVQQVPAWFHQAVTESYRASAGRDLNSEFVMNAKTPDAKVRRRRGSHRDTEAQRRDTRHGGLARPQHFNELGESSKCRPGPLCLCGSPPLSLAALASWRSHPLLPRHHKPVAGVFEVFGVADARAVAQGQHLGT